ncbi:MAG TPA: protein translocase subunit SecD [Solirubrobacteraceae bacterium]|nr:protein translocase subunit SecD [Solirubrobacteraceae bacterium]
MSDRRRSLFILLLVFGLIAVSAVVVATKETKLGLDLQGGVQLVYEGKPTPQQPTVDQQALDRALQIMRERVDAFGVAEPELALIGGRQVEVNLPGVEDADRAADQVGSTAQLYFYDWEANVLNEDCRTNDTETDGGTQAIAGLRAAVERASKCTDVPEADSSVVAAAPRFYAFNKISKQPFQGATGLESRQAALDAVPKEDRENAEVLEVPKGVLVVRDEKAAAGKDGKEPPAPDRWWVLLDRPALSGTDLKNPEQNFDQRGGGQPIVTFDFTDKGRKAFQSITRKIAQRGADNSLPGVPADQGSQSFAIVLDDELVSKPVINYQENPDGIDGSTGAQISGGFTIQSAQDLAKILQIGALPIKLELISRSQVSASLGAQALDQGLIAGVVGLGIVALFLIGYYRVLGLVASLALLIYALYFYALVKAVPVVLTLPGIAGLVLTLGVAADANIVIFERVKEEVRAGRGVSTAIVNGYRKGLTAIIDANVVTLLVAFILFILATAGVKGFAFMLGLGVIVSLFTAVLATQAILFSLRGTRLIRGRAGLGSSEQRFNPRKNYMGASKWFFSASGLIMLIGAFAIAGNGLNFGIDFEGGTRITAPLEQKANVDQVRDVVRGAGLTDAEVQTINNPELGRNLVQISSRESGAPVRAATDALDNEFGVAGQPNEESIGPTFGQSVGRSALIAIIASLTVISVYIALRFEWKVAVPVLIALMHDILITGGVYALTGREVTTSTVAALLTILGFSLYDTIIVFDRVRENIPRMPSAAFSQIVNRSMSEVVVRSLATSFCTLLPVLSLYFLGGETLQDFAFALIVGTASGTYSSIFIAAPVLTHWKEREPVYAARERRIKERLGYVPAYATVEQGGPVDVAPAAPRGGRRGGVTTPQDPSQGVSRAEFDDMVANLGIEEAGRREPAAAAARGNRPAGGRRARARGEAPPPPATGPAPADGEGSDAPKPKKPRNRKHGRPR